MNIEEAKKQHEELGRMIGDHNEQEARKHSKGFVGRAFVYRDNCYSMPENPEDYWCVFYYVTGAEAWSLDVIKVQRPEGKRLEIDLVGSCHPTTVEDLEEISVEAFFSEMQEAIDEAQGLLTNTRPSTDGREK